MTAPVSLGHVPGHRVEQEAAEPDLQWLTDTRAPDWNGPVDRPFSALLPSDLEWPIVSLLERRVRCDPDRVALSDERDCLTYGQLWEQVCALGEQLAAQTRPGELIALALPDCLRFAVAFLACLAAGRPFLALDGQALQGGREALRDACPALLVADRPVSGETPCLCLTAPLRGSGRWRPAALGPDEPACVLLTSGSTGSPKGIVNSQRALLQRVAHAVQGAHFNASDRFLTLAPLCTMVGVRDILTALLSGAALHLSDPRIACGELHRLLRARRITVLFAFPGLLRVLSGEPAGADLRLVRVGGDTLLWSDVERLRTWLRPGARVQLIYAATEAPITQWFPEGDPQGDPRVPVGYPLPGTYLAVVDEAGRSVPRGQAGELVVAGACVALGVWREGGLRAQHLRPGVPGGRLLRTGERVRQRPDGLLERLGRMDRQVKISGVRVELEGIEALLRQHPGVREVGVLARTIGEGETVLVAYVSPAPEASPALLTELEARMRTSPPALRPAQFHRLPELPRLPNAKLDLGALQRLDEALCREICPHPTSREGLAAAVAGAWREVLGAPPGDEADFFAAGGDSLRAIRLVRLLERELGRALPLTLLSEAPIFAGLCARLQRGAPPAVKVLLKPGVGRPVFFVPGIGGQVAELFATVRRLNYPGPVYGLQARGSGRGLPQVSVEAMARGYLREIHGCGEGPWHLCGYSFGGLVAFEMARQLQEAGETPGLVGLFDTLPRTPLLPGIPPSLREVPVRSALVRMAGWVAARRYRPGRYPGTLTLFVPQERRSSGPDVSAAWAAHAQTVSLIRLPGTHVSMLSPAYAEQAAAALSLQLAKA